jgi:hypothetical protein
MNDAHQVVAAYWAAAESRDWDTFADLVAEQVVYEAPQFRERVRGRAAYVRFNVEGFPGDWHLTVQRIVGEGRHGASVYLNNDALPEHRRPSGHVLYSRSGAEEPWPAVAGSAQFAGPGGLWSSLPARAARLSWRAGFR